ncbi:BTAD domain-containing putative transcriptional regulator [Actinoplanes sp. NPDC051494]|uniref:AfsR/SARP family transcriptional regulator n=1 Tax=Actinoplanes sp. NPDC051494 TaxID=3363907 RepID=UPI003793D3B4
MGAGITIQRDNTRPAARLRLQIMGPLRVWRGDVELEAGPRQQRCLLALLAARVGSPITMTDLVDLIWGPDAPTSAVNVIHKYIGMLRRMFEPELPLRAPGTYLVRHGNGYRFTAGPETLDLVAFRRSVAAARSCTDRDQLDEALDHYTDALRLCHGSTADSLADSSPAVATFARIDGEFFDATVAAAGIAVRAGRPAQVLAPLRVAANLGRLHEPVHASLVTALAAAGHQAEALATYRRIQERLADELDITPGGDLREAQRRALTPTVAPAAAPPPEPQAVPVVRPAQLPPDLSLFAGRTTELTVLGDLVAAAGEEQRTGPMVVAVDGMGGVGKSTMAVHFAHLVAGRFTDGQLYLDLRGHLGRQESVPAGEALRSLLCALGVRAPDVPDTFDALIGMYRSLTADKRVLLLLDNVRDPEQVRPLLPSSAAGLVLVTSRHPQLGLAVFDGARLLHASVPGLPEAREMIQRRLTVLNRPPADRDAELLDEIIELCGRLPLALAILAARLAARPRLSLSAVAAELRDGANLLQAFSGGHGLNDPRSAFAWSYRQLSPGAARLFRLMSVTPNPAVPADACASLSGQDPESTRVQLRELTEAALVAEQGTGRFASHVLVKAYADELFRAAESPEQRREAIGRLLNHYLLSGSHARAVLEPGHVPDPPPRPLPGVTPARPGTCTEAVDWFATEHEVLKDVVRMAADLGYGIVPWHLAVTMRNYLHWAGLFQDWEDVMRSALLGARQQGDTIGEAHAQHGLAGARWSLGAHEEALRLLAAALETFRRQGLPRPQATIHSDLSRIHDALGHHDRALAHSDQARRLHHTLGDHRAEVTDLMAGARSLMCLHRSGEAVRAMETALEVEQPDPVGLDRGDIRIAIAYDLVGIGSAREALRHLELSAERSPQPGLRAAESDALRRLMELLVTTGDRPAARRILDRIRESPRER